MEGHENKNMSDMELALFWVNEIEKPCGDGAGNNVRSVYIREAKKLLPEITNPGAKAMLDSTIKKYE